MNADREQSGFDPLDELLAKAEWPEPTAESTRRLRRQWAAIQPRSRRQIAWPRLAAAAAVIVVATLGIYRGARRPEPTPRHQTPENSALDVALVGRSRPATPLELAALRVSEPPGKGTKRIVPEGVPLIPLVTGWGMNVPSASAGVPDAIGGLSSPSLGTRGEGWGGGGSPINSAPTLALPRSTGGGNQSSPPIVSRIPPAAPITQPPDPAALAHLALSTSDPRQRELAAAELLALGPSHSEGLVFNLLANAQTSQAVVAAICQNAGEWTNSLFAALDDPRVAVRQASAEALARIDGSVVTQRLAEMAELGVDRPEAVAALVRIHSPQARKFVVAALQSPQLRAIVRSAVLQDDLSHPQMGVIP